MKNYPWEANMMRNVATVLILVCGGHAFDCSAAGPQPRPALSSNCSQRIPPASSTRVSTHAGEFKQFPAVIPREYSGCQLAWLNGELITVARFSEGKVYRLLVTAEGEKLRCDFIGRTVKSGPKSHCLEMLGSVEKATEAAREARSTQPKG
jgi:hypothetical protein